MTHSTTAQAPTRAPRHRSARPLAVAVATALVASGLAFAASVPAHAATSASSSTTNVTNATFAWGFNQYTAANTGTSHSAFVLAGAVAPAAADTSTSTLGFTVTGGSGVLDADGDGTLSFAGAVQYRQPDDPSAFTYQFSNFELAINADRGSLSAVVDGTTATFFNTASNGARVVIANFGITGETVSAGSFSLTTAVPDYVTTSYANGSWPETLLAVIPAAAKGFWSSSSQTAAQQSKKPLAMSVAGDSDSLAVTATTTATTPKNGFALTVAGTGFTPVTNPGDAGIYVAIAETGNRPDLSSMSAISQFLTAAFVPTASFTAGAFSTSLTVPTAEFDTAKSYSVYTWQAHSHSNVSQDSETPLVIDYASLAWQDSSISVAASDASAGAPVTITAAVPATATGSVGFFDGTTLLGSAPVAAGVASVSTTTLAVGAHPLTATYSGDDYRKAVTSAARLVTISAPAVQQTATPAPTVAATKVAPKITLSATSFVKGSKPKVTVTLKKLSTGKYPTGNVRIYVNGKSVKVVRLTASKKGKVSVTLPKRYSKSIKVSVKYGGSSTVKAITSKTVKYTVKK